MQIVIFNNGGKIVKNGEKSRQYMPIKILMD